MKWNHFYFLFFLFLFVSCQTDEKEDRKEHSDNSILDLKITNQGEVILENNIIVPDSINSNISDRVKSFSKDELDKLTIKMIVEEEVDMLLLMKVRNQLKKGKYRIEYIQN